MKKTVIATLLTLFCLSSLAQTHSQGSGRGQERSIDTEIGSDAVSSGNDISDRDVERQEEHLESDDIPFEQQDMNNHDESEWDVLDGEEQNLRAE